MNKNMWVIIAIVVIIIIGLGVVYSFIPKNEPVIMEQNESPAAQNQAEGNLAGRMDENEIMVKGGSYEPYDPEKLALADSGDVVLFFRAPWCPTCRTLDADIKASVGSIPAGVTILDVDYDSSTALKQKYGVTYQHTMVQVDSQGNQIAKWTGSLTLASFLANIK